MRLGEKLVSLSLHFTIELKYDSNHLRNLLKKVHFFIFTRKSFTFRMRSTNVLISMFMNASMGVFKQMQTKKNGTRNEILVHNINKLPIFNIRNSF